MKTAVRCERCGSAGSIEFGMCQVCLTEYPEYTEYEYELPFHAACEAKPPQDGSFEEGVLSGYPR